MHLVKVSTCLGHWVSALALGLAGGGAARASRSRVAHTASVQEYFLRLLLYDYVTFG